MDGWMDGVLGDLRKLGVLRVGRWLPRTGNLGGKFFGKPSLILGCSVDYGDDDLFQYTETNVT
jgi:hypothetical protein